MKTIRHHSRAGNGRKKALALKLLVMAGWILSAGWSWGGAVESPGPSSRRTGMAITEIMYRPPSPGVQFVELYNADLTSRDLSGFALRGSWDYVFPANTVLAAGSYLVVGVDAQALKQAYSITNVLGGASGDLARDNGLLRLVSAAGAILLEIHYSSSPPWREAADGGGHSLVLSRPSYGEGDVRAWDASRAWGGSPGTTESSQADPLQNVKINEVLANSESPSLDYIELFNRGAIPLDLSGCYISDTPETNKFQVPANTVLPAFGFVVFDEAQLGFGLKARGDSIFVRKADGRNVIDALQFGAQSSGVASGCSPDGAGRFRPLAANSPGSANGPAVRASVVINEIMYHPISEDSRDEYVELYNRGREAVDLGGWKLEAGIAFEFPAGVVLGPGAYLVVAADQERLRTHYPNLNQSNLVGNFTGQLSNQGERIALVRPESQSRNGAAAETIGVVVNEVTYGEGGTWGQWADGGGSSLELIDPLSDNELASNWADSDESSKSAWTDIENTGVLDLGRGSINALQVLAQGPGDYLIDNVEVLDASGANRVANSTFESGLTGWALQGSHASSFLETQGGFNSKQSLHLQAVTRGDTIANRLMTSLTSPLNAGETATLRAKVRWLRGRPELLLRLYGNYLEAFGPLNLPVNLGSPGLPNSRLKPNAGPAILEVQHYPVLPAANQTIQVSARVEDPDSVAQVIFHYRIDPSPQTAAIVMRDDGSAGDGIYTASVPGQNQGALVAFWIEAIDAGSPAATNRFPASTGEGLVRVGEQKPSGTLATYRLWMTQNTFQQWSSRSKLDNTPLPLTFVYNSDRVIYNAKGLFAGSPHISPGYTTPSGVLSGYVIMFPDDEPFLGTTEIVLDWPDRDSSKVEEQSVYWMAEQMGLPNLYRRFIHLHVNGVTEAQRGGIYEDAQQVNSDYLRSWHTNQDTGDLFKIEQWFEYDVNGSRSQLVAPTLEKFTTTGGAYKTARYRWNWLKRAVDDSANDYSDLFSLAQAANLTDPAEYTAELEVFADIEEWMRVFALEHIIGNFDSYGHTIGKNMYAYKPAGGRWEMHMWDIDWLMNASIALGVTPTSPLFDSEDPVISRMYAHPPFRRAYYRAVQDAVYGPLESARVNAWLDERQAALVANGVSAGSTSTGKTWLSQRRNYLLQQLSSVNAPFQITFPAGSAVSNQNWIVLQGTAPVEVARIQVGGITYPVTWNTVTNWQMVVPLSNGAQTLQLQGLNRFAQPLANAQATLAVNSTAPLEPPTGKIVINEILYRPVQTNTEFVELYNVSNQSLYDLSGWRLQGVDFTFPAGSLIGPNQYRVIAKDVQAYTAAFGNATALLGAYAGNLKPEGETLYLLSSASPGGQTSVVDQVTYDDAPPWPQAAAQSGSSLQLINPLADNNEARNWASLVPAPTNLPPATNAILVPLAQAWKYNQSGQDLGSAWKEIGYNDSAWPSGAALLYVENASLPGPKNTPLSLGPATYYFRTHFQYPANAKGGSLQLSLVVDDGAVVYLNGREIWRLGMPSGDIQASTWANRTTGDAILEGPWIVDGSALAPGDNLLAAEVHQVNASSTDVVFGLALELAPLSGNNAFQAYTPGRQNSVIGQAAELVVQASPLSKNLLLLTWDAEFNRSYDIEYKDQLNAPSWQRLQTVTAASTQVRQPVPLNGESQRFYRIRQVD